MARRSIRSESARKLRARLSNRLTRGVALPKDDLFKRGIWPYFQRNPIGTVIGIAMLFMLLYWSGSPVGPFASYTPIQNEFSQMYNSSSWLGELSIVLIFVAAPGLMVMGLDRKPKEPEQVEEMES